MIIARNKRKNDIAGYVLYMWQIEDLIRAAGVDMETIKSTLIEKYEQPEEVKKELYNWYDNLVEMMRIEKKEKGGHLQVLINTVNEMNQLHLHLLGCPKEVAYQHQFSQALPLVGELKNKMQPQPGNDVELMLAAIYNAFALKLKGEELTSGTAGALRVFGNLLSLLSKKYREEQEGKLNTE